MAEELELQSGCKMRQQAGCRKVISRAVLRSKATYLSGSITGIGDFVNF